MPDKKNKAAFNQIVLDWFRNNGTAVPKGLPNVCKFGSNNQEFSIIHKFMDTYSGYQNALGYCLYNGKLLCRHFYKSRSESYWRAGMGFREDKSSWVKGAEGHPDDMAGGYIFEGMLHPEFHKKLELLMETIEITELDCGINTALITLNNKDLDNYLINRATRSSDIVNIYAKDRVKTDVIKNVPMAIQRDHLKKSQVFFQESVRPKTKGIPSGRDADNIADQLKSDTGLWKEINKCLDTKVAEYEFKHDLLDKVCNVISYALGTAFIEIAYTKKPLDMEYLSVSGAKCTVNSPVCWVKSVYVGTKVSTFGNYLEYPEDLCFLVQKPMDYIDQARTRERGLTPRDHRTESEYEIVKRMGVHGRLVDQGKAAERFQVDREDLRENIQLSYIRLALYDEKYSPLIIRFKEKNKFPLFKWTSQKFINKSVENTIKAYKSGDHLKDLKDGLMRSCQEYLADKNNEHGKRGINRVRKFSGYMSEKDSYNEINQAVYDLFKNNKVNGVSYWIPIRTTETSYFTIFCRHILGALFEFAHLAYAYKDQKNKDFQKVVEDEYEKRTNKAMPNDAIGRLALKAIMKDAYDNQRVFTKEGNKIREDLLNAIKDYK
jgi:hypothetical protein